jgi:hypothetical protein
MPAYSENLVIEDGLLVDLRNQVWLDVFARAPNNGGRNFGIPTAYVQYESAHLQRADDGGSDFVRENPNKGRVSGVVDGQTLYETILFERLPLFIVRRRVEPVREEAIICVCEHLGLDPKERFKRDAYKSLLAKYL